MMLDDRAVIESGQAKTIPCEMVVDTHGNQRCVMPDLNFDAAPVADLQRFRRFFKTIKVPFTTSLTDKAILGLAMDITEHVRTTEDLDQVAPFAFAWISTILFLPQAALCAFSSGTRKIA